MSRAGSREEVNSKREYSAPAVSFFCAFFITVMALIPLEIISMKLFFLVGSVIFFAILIYYSALVFMEIKRGL